MQKVLVKINLSHLRANAAAFSQKAKVPLYAVVKADAYGHGAQEVALALSGQVQGYAVSLIEEGLALSSAACGKEILVFTPPTDEKEVWLMLKNGLIVTVSSMVSARLVDKVSKVSGLPARVHLKCNTGMNRYGLTNAALGKVCTLLSGNKKVLVEGIYSHLYAHDLPTATTQREKFLSARTICRRYFPRVKAHLSATYGALLGKEFAFDAVRIGLGLYGYLPDDVEEKQFPLKKVMTVYAKCAEERLYAFGGTGYSHYAPEKGARLRTCRYGYADGFGYTCNLQGLPVKPLSSPCMDACICRGEERRATGKWLPVMTDARLRAKAEKSITYEILCRASARAERVYGYWR